MFPLTRILSLTAAGALVALTAASIPARAGELTQNLGQVAPHAPTLTDCRLLKRAISRRACQARLWHKMQVDTAENK
jgi:hypothetical protein